MKQLVAMVGLVLLGSVANAHPLQAHPQSGMDAASAVNGRAAQISSITCTLVPVAAGLLLQNQVGAVLGMSGLLLGPSVGYFVGRHPVRGVTGALGRTGLALVGVSALHVALVQGLSYGDDQAATRAAAVGSVLGFAVIGSAIYDMATVHATVDRHAAKVARVRLQGMRAPGSGAPAMALTVKF